MSRPIAAILAERQAHVDAIAAIDAELAASGIRAIRAQIVRGRLVASAVLAALEERPLRVATIAKQTGMRRNALYQMLHVLAKAGEVVRVGHGVYALPSRAPAAEGVAS